MDFSFSTPPDVSLLELPAQVLPRNILRTLGQHNIHHCRTLVEQKDVPKGITPAKFESIKTAAQRFLKVPPPSADPLGYIHFSTEAHTWYGKKIHYMAKRKVDKKRYKRRVKRGVVKRLVIEHKNDTTHILMEVEHLKQEPVLLATLQRLWHSVRVVSDDEREYDAKEHEPQKLPLLRIQEDISSLPAPLQASVKQMLVLTNDVLLVK